MKSSRDRLAEIRAYSSFVTANCVKAAGGATPIHTSAAQQSGFGSSLTSLQGGELARHFHDIVYTAIRPIAQRIAGQSLHVASTPVRGGKSMRLPHQKFPNLKKMPAMMASQAERMTEFTDHPLLTCLQDPNDLMVQWMAIYMMICSLEITGWHYILIVKKKDRVQLWPLPTSWVTPITNEAGFNAEYLVRPDALGVPETIPGDEIVQLRYPDPNDPTGAISPLMAQLSAVTNDENILKTQGGTFKGMMPTYAVIAGNIEDPASGATGAAPLLEKPQRDQIINAIRSRYRGAASYGEPIILDALIKDIKRLSATNQEMDFLGSAAAMERRIMMGFGVNPIIAGQVESSSRAASAEADRHFCNNTINPKIEMISQCLTAWLGPVFAKENEKLWIWIEPAQPKDSEDRRAWVQMVADRGGLSLNELRAEIGYEPSDNPDADELLVPFDRMPLGSNYEDPAAADENADPKAPAAKVDPNAAVVADTALNGAQVTSLLSLCELIADGTISPEAGRGIIAASFPTLTADQIDTIISNIEVKPPSESTEPAADTPPATEDPAAEGKSARPKAVNLLMKSTARVWLKAHARSQPAMIKKLRGYFQAQGKSFVKDLAQVLDGEETLEGKDAGVLVEQCFGSVGEWAGQLADLVEPSLIRAGIQGAALQVALITRIGRGAEAKGKDEDRLKDALLASVIRQIKTDSVGTSSWKLINETTKTKLTKVVQRSIDRGDTPDQLATAISTATSRSATANRAAGIALVELNCAMNCGRTVAFDDFIKDGLDLVQEWVSMGDDLVRETHDEADGQVIEDGELFVVGDCQTPYPGHSSMPIEERANCRCIALGVPRDSVAVSALRSAFQNQERCRQLVKRQMAAAG